ncbi:MAG: enoyl-CoA hydratase/isomerase family protein [Chloroflexi bacterium]|nr:enoyl-CoA hydratase/isomerase family protein [Chloroflexota bacterium]
MTYQTIQFETEGPLGLLTLNRQERLNAISREVTEEMQDLVTRLETDVTIRVLIVTGAGRAFCAGADIKERTENLDNLSLARTSAVISPTFRRFERLNQVSIAAVNGVAAGGGLELAMACDLRIASSEARMALPELTLGILPGAGGTQRLPRLIGPARAKEMMLFGRFIDAQTALAWGLVNAVSTPGGLLEEARVWAGRLLELPPLSLASIKNAVNVAMDVDLDSGIQYEQRCSAMLALTEDRREGHIAFVEKRAPVFTGR